MSIQHYIKCEMCDNKHEIAFLYKAAIWRELPAEWITLHSTGCDATENDGWHFCSDTCLVQWVSGNATPEEADNPPCKARRFILVEGETEKSYAGVKFASGHVAVDFDTGDYSVTYPSWDIFIKTLQDDDRVEWVDQEPKS